MNTAVFPSDQLVSSVGVVAHLDYGDAYQNYSGDYGAPTGTPPERTYKPLLADLGIRWVRAGLKPWPDRHAFGIFQVNDLCEALGIRTLAGVGDTASWCANLRNLLRGIYDRDAILALELANEPAVDNALQAQVWGVAGWIAQHPEWGMPIVAPSLVDTAQWRGLDAASYVDFGNVHPYAGGLPPEGALDQRYANASSAVAGKPVAATEIGYWTGDTAGGARYDLPPEPGVPESVQAAYIVRAVAAGFERNPASLTAIYELLDQWPENSDGQSRFGLVRNDYTPKPAFTALQWLLKALADPGASSTPWPYRVAIENAPANLHTLALRKSNGTIDLLIWTDDSLWDRDAHIALDPGTVTIDVSVDTPGWQYDVYGWLGQVDEQDVRRLPTPTTVSDGPSTNGWRNFNAVTIKRGHLYRLEIHP